MDRFEYQVYDRPNFEAVQSVAWFSSSIATTLLASSFGITSSVLNLVLPGIFATIGSYRAYKSYEQFLLNSGFKPEQNIEFISYEELKKKIKPDAIWLGKGFAWTPVQTQRLYDEFLRNPEVMQNLEVDNPNAQIGAFWLHGLGDGERDIYKNIETFAGHTLIDGVTGAGKTRTIDIIVAQLLNRKDEPLIMIDPKNDKDARENIERICKKEGRQFFYFHPAFPEKSVRIDILHSWSRVTQISDRIKAILPEEDAFANIIWNVINAIGSCLVLIGERPSIVSFRKYMSESQMDKLIIKAIETHASNVEPEWQKLYAPYAAAVSSNKKSLNSSSAKLISLITFYNEVLANEHPNLDVAELINIRTHNREHLQKLIASLFPVLSMLSSGGLGELLSPTPDPEDPRPIITTKQIVDEKAVIWIGLDSLSDKTVAAQIGSILLSDLTALAGARYNEFGTTSTKKVNLIVDEVGEVINPPLIQMLNKARGAGFRCFLLTQTLADLAVGLGDSDRARMAIGNINNDIILRLKDAETAKHFSESLPEVMVRKMSVQYQSNVGHNPIEQFGGRYGEGMEEEYFPTIPPWAFGILPDLHFFANFKGGALVKGRLPILKD